MRRKLVKQGRNALTVTLPSGWTKKFGLKAGDDVDIQETGRGLVVATEKDRSLEAREFDTRGIKEFKNYYLSFFYHQGFDEIKVFYDDKNVIDIARKKASELIGYEIIEAGKNYFIVKSLSKIDESEFDALLRRTFLLIKSMGQECLDSISEKDYARLKEIRNLEKTNNKFTDLCIRILNKKGGPGEKDHALYYILVRELEKLCDNYKYICDLEDMKGADKEALSFFKKANDYFCEFYELFYKFDEKGASVFMNRKNSLIDEGYGIMGRASKGVNPALMHHLMNILNQTFDLKGILFEMNIE